MIDVFSWPAKIMVSPFNKYIWYELDKAYQERKPYICP